MLIRFLIVVLAILNIGVALWWMVPRTLPPVASEAAEAGVATLELVAEAAAGASPGPGSASAPVAGRPAPARPAPEAADAIAAARTEAATVPAPRPESCVSLGPFAGREQAQAAVAALGTALARSRLREAPGKAAASYRVLIPPAASREDAQAMVKRIVDAGFSDYFIISQGDDVNAVALGQYRNREGAERRLAALTAAGFPAQVVGNGTEQAASWWLDAAYAGAIAAAELERRSGATQRQSLDCARLR